MGNYDAGVGYDEVAFPYDGDNSVFVTGPPAYPIGVTGPLYRFDPPVRLQIPLETRPIFSLWTRRHINMPATLLKRSSDNTWQEYAGAWPQTEDSSAKYFFGLDGHGFSGLSQGAVTSTDQGFPGCDKLYLGGHIYIINTPLRDELIAIVTPQEPTGYGAYITTPPADSQFTGDEIMCSGRNGSFDQNTVVVDNQSKSLH